MCIWTSHKHQPPPAPAGAAHSPGDADADADAIAPEPGSPPPQWTLHVTARALNEDDFYATERQLSDIFDKVPPPSRTKWTRRVPHPVLIGHAASLTPY